MQCLQMKQNVRPLLQKVHRTLQAHLLQTHSWKLFVPQKNVYIIQLLVVVQTMYPSIQWVAVRLAQHLQKNKIIGRRKRRSQSAFFVDLFYRLE